jgi:hypothetical protein
MSITNIRGITATDVILDEFGPYPGQFDFRNFQLQYLTNYPSYDGIFGRYGRNTNSVFEFKTNPVKPKDFYLPTGRHRRISDFLNDSEILINPEKYFGPNCKILLNFWIYWESLTSEQRYTYYSRVNKLSTDIYNEARVLAKKTAGQSLFKQLLNTLTYLEKEIVGMHEILEEGKSLTFIPLLENL